MAQSDSNSNQRKKESLTIEIKRKQPKFGDQSVLPFRHFAVRHRVKRSAVNETLTSRHDGTRAMR